MDLLRAEWVKTKLGSKRFILVHVEIQQSYQVFRESFANCRNNSSISVKRNQNIKALWIYDAN